MRQVVVTADALYIYTSDEQWSPQQRHRLRASCDDAGRLSQQRRGLLDHHWRPEASEPHRPALIATDRDNFLSQIVGPLLDRYQKGTVRITVEEKSR